MEAFETDNVTVAVVCLDSNRVAQLIDWTIRELTIRSRQELADLFLFTSDSSVENPQGFFFDQVWSEADTGEAVSLVDFPMRTSEGGVVFQTT